MTDLDTLEALAKAATPGPWKWHFSNIDDGFAWLGTPGCDFIDLGVVLDDGSACGEYGQKINPRGADAAYIAAANPAVMLEMIEKLRAATKEAERLRAVIVDFRTNAGRHQGAHDADGGIQCAACVAAYNHAEMLLDWAIKEKP